MTLWSIILGYQQRYETISPFESFLSIWHQNYQHLLITIKELKSLKKWLKIDDCRF